MLIDSLPDRPLKRKQVDALGDIDSVSGIFPIYGERQMNQNTCPGFAIALGEKLKGFVYISDGWQVVDEIELDHPAGGVHPDEFHHVDDLHSQISSHL